MKKIFLFACVLTLLSASCSKQANFSPSQNGSSTIRVLHNPETTVGNNTQNEKSPEWKIYVSDQYKSDEFRYSIQYPENMPIQDAGVNGAGDEIFFGSSIVLQVTPKPNGKTIKDIATSATKNFPSATTTFSAVAGYPAVHFRDYYDAVYINVGSYVYNFYSQSWPNGPDLMTLRNVYDSMLQSLRIYPALNYDNLSRWVFYKDPSGTFELRYPAYLASPTVTPDSVLSNANNHVGGVIIGGLVVVTAADSALKKTTEDYISQFLEVADNPQELQTDGPAMGCHRIPVINSFQPVEAVKCAGEGGTAFYAVARGKGAEVFIDGYSRGWSNTAEHPFKSDEHLQMFLSTLKVTK